MSQPSRSHRQLLGSLAELGRGQAWAWLPRRPAARRTASPWKLGGLSLRELASRVYGKIWDDEILDRAAALSYYSLFSMFPALLFLTVLVGFFPRSHLIGQLLSYLGEVLPPDAASLVRQTLREIVRGAHSSLLSVGAVVALWSASTGMASVMGALNVVYDVDDPRPWWQRRLLALVLTAGSAVFTLSALLLLVLGPQIGERVATRVGVASLFGAAWTTGQWPVLIALVLTGIAFVYYWAPAAQQ